MGFYPVCPATEQYVLGTPYFQKMTIHLENGNDIIINADDNSEENKYMNQLRVNGKTYTKNWLNHFELLKGAQLDFDMQSIPNKKRGTSKDSYPYSLSNQ